MIWMYLILGIVCFVGGLLLVGYYAKSRYHRDTWAPGVVSKEWKQCRLDERQWKLSHPVLAFFEDIYYRMYRFFNLFDPRDWYRECRWGIQRGQRGYSDRDVWGFFAYLTRVISGGLKDLQEMIHGYPSGLVDESTDPDGSKGAEKWREIIGEILWTFEAIQKIDNHEWLLCPNENLRSELEEFEQKLNTKYREDDVDLGVSPHTYHLMTVEEMKKYNRGWDLFKEYYFSLWD